MVWGGISMEAQTELVFIENGSLNAHHYINEILMNHIVPFAPFIGDEFVLMHVHTQHAVYQSTWTPWGLFGLTGQLAAWT